MVPDKGKDGPQKSVGPEREVEVDAAGVLVAKLSRRRAAIFLPSLPPVVGESGKNEIPWLVVIGKAAKRKAAKATAPSAASRKKGLGRDALLKKIAAAFKSSIMQKEKNKESGGTSKKSANPSLSKKNKGSLCWCRKAEDKTNIHGGRFGDLHQLGKLRRGDQSRQGPK